MRKRPEALRRGALKVSLCDDECQRSAWPQPLVGRGVGDHAGNVEFITSVMGSLRKYLVLLTGRFRAFAVGVWELRPAYPRWVPNDQIKLARRCRPKKLRTIRNQMPFHLWRCKTKHLVVRALQRIGPASELLPVENLALRQCCLAIFIVSIFFDEFAHDREDLDRECSG